MRISYVSITHSQPQTTTTMSTSKATAISKLSKEKNQRILLELVSQPGNGKKAVYYWCFFAQIAPDACADCKGMHSIDVSRHIIHRISQPRHLAGLHIISAFSSGTLASIALLSILTCRSVHCASIHRKIGTHITRVYVNERARLWLNPDVFL